MVEGAALEITFFRYSPAPKLNTEWYRSGHNGTDSKSVVPHGTVGSNPTHSAIENPHKPSVYADFPYLNTGTAGIKIPAVLLFFPHCYHGFQNNTLIEQAREAKGKSVTNSRIVVKMLSKRIKAYKAI